MDLTDLWVMMQKRQHIFLQLIIALLLFGVGWQFGRVTSPYFAASPIVFQDRDCTGCASSGGTPQELQALREEGNALAQGKATTNPTPTAAVAGARTEETRSAASSTPAAEKIFVASVNSNLYHEKSCSSADRIKPENQVWFSTTAEAEAAGYSPSACTKEKLGI